jgi:hypothetical protein
MKFKPNNLFPYYLYWVCERQNIFWNRYNCILPWTDDEVFHINKFTNVYKVLDRSSQFEIKNVIYNNKGLNNDYSSEDIFYRILIYKHFNLPFTWEIIEKEFGDITTDVKLKDISNFIKDYCSLNIDYKPYNNAYMLTSAFLKGENCKYSYLKGNGWKKYEYYFHIFKKEIFDNGFIYKILQSSSLEDMFNKFKSISSFADFLSYQYIIDMNYSQLFNFDENSFSIAGLGTVRGIERVFDIEGEPDYSLIINWVRENFEQLLEDYNKNIGIKLEFISLPGRLPTNVDFSNCFCETDKYLRTSNINTDNKNIEGKRIKNKFKINPVKIEYVFPPKWGIIF